MAKYKQYKYLPLLDCYFDKKRCMKEITTHEECTNCPVDCNGKIDLFGIHYITLSKEIHEIVKENNIKKGN